MLYLSNANHNIAIMECMPKLNSILAEWALVALQLKCTLPEGTKEGHTRKSRLSECLTMVYGDAMVKQQTEPLKEVVRVVELALQGEHRFEARWEGIEHLSRRVHQLASCIKHDGPASISHYFKPKPTGVRDEGLPLQQEHFRGKLLQGTTLYLPHGYSVFVLGKKSSPPTSNKSFQSWDMNAMFQDITYWNHEYALSHDDELFRAFIGLLLQKL
ncbi:Ribonuclease H2, subunit C [Spatholobus suberectus]|nr:Ribonuclease H2, subunit C [Spatholobus suberectus]